MLTMVDDKNIGFALGATDYMTKPIDRNRLANLLGRYRCSSGSCGVLLVEDDDVTREMMRALLTREGWNVTEATNGRFALECLESAVPDLILLDLMMPEMDGFEFAHRLRERPEWQRHSGHRSDGQRPHGCRSAPAERLCRESACKRARGIATPCCARSERWSPPGRKKSRPIAPSDLMPSFLTSYPARL